MSIVEHVRVRLLHLPNAMDLKRPVGTIRDRFYLVAEVHSSAGSCGIAYARAYDVATARASLAYAEQLAQCLVGMRTASTGRAHEDMKEYLRIVGVHGPQMYALSTLDSALWDAKAQDCGLPLHRLLGGLRESIPAYHSGGWLSNGPQETAREFARLTQEGFGAAKLRVGAKHLAEDTARLAAAREVFDGEIMLDASEAWTVPQAVRAIEAFRPYNPHCVEDPVAMRDAPRLAGRVKLSIAGGEHVHGVEEAAEKIASGAYDYTVVDLQRIGGVTGWAQVSAIAQNAGRQILSHVFSELAAPLLCGLPAGGYVEYLAWTSELFEETVHPVDGMIRCSEKPGFGLRFDQDFLRRYCVGDASAAVATRLTGT